jgi:hypothetical protein
VKKFILYIRDFIRADFKLWLYVYVALFLGISITLNFTFNFERKVIESPHGGWLGVLYFFLFYGFSYYAVAIPVLIANKEKHILFQRSFWVKTGAFLLLLSFAAAFYYHREWVKTITPMPDRLFVSKVLNQFGWAMVYIPGFIAMKFLFDRRNKGFYGLTKTDASLKPYLTMLLIVSPLIIAASFLPDFMIAYPRFKPWMNESAFGLNILSMTGIYETVYGTGYMMVELMFRGGMVIGLIAILGRNAILPMVSCYCFLHFSKPLGEAISSVFGGYILGIIAYRTRNIWGGVIIHLGIAWLMEVMGLFQFYVWGMRR